jgi:hypothetical protein
VENDKINVIFFGGFPGVPFLFFMGKNYHDIFALSHCSFLYVDLGLFGDLYRVVVWWDLSARVDEFWWVVLWCAYPSSLSDIIVLDIFHFSNGIFNGLGKFPTGFLNYWRSFKRT